MLAVRCHDKKVHRLRVGGSQDSVDNGSIDDTGRPGPAIDVRHLEPWRGRARPDMQQFHGDGSRFQRTDDAWQCPEGGVGMGVPVDREHDALQPQMAGSEVDETVDAGGDEQRGQRRSLKERRRDVAVQPARHAIPLVRCQNDEIRWVVPKVSEYRVRRIVAEYFDLGDAHAKSTDGFPWTARWKECPADQHLPHVRKTTEILLRVGLLRHVEDGEFAVVDEAQFQRVSERHIAGVRQVRRVEYSNHASASLCGPVRRSGHPTGLARICQRSGRTFTTQDRSHVERSPIAVRYIALMAFKSGRHYLQVPGPTNVPERVLRAMAAPTIDHRGPGFQLLAREVLQGLASVLRTNHPVVLFPASGTGAWEAALANTLSPGDRVLMYETGHFSTLWRKIADSLGLKPDFLPGDWRHGVDAVQIEAALAADTQHAIKAVCVVHNETSTGVTSDIPGVRKAIDTAQHPALLLVDTISSLGSIDYRHDEWGVDVTVGASQKGLMLPPGLSFNAVSDKALAARKHAQLPVSYWDWEPILAANQQGFFPYTPATNLLFGLREALIMLEAEGLEHVFARHTRHAEATRRAVRAWELELLCANPAEYSSALTAVMMPEGHDASRVLGAALDRFDLSLGIGLGILSGKVFRIGHLGDFNDLTLLGTLGGVEMAMVVSGVPHKTGGVGAAMAYLAECAGSTA